MAFANSSYTDILATTIESRTGTVADNVRDSNALLTVLNKRGRIRPWSGGSTILQELSFQDNGTAQYYSGSEAVNVNPSDVISASQFPIKQACCAVTITGLEQLQNSSEEQVIDLLDARLDVAEASLENLISAGLYSDGTGSNGKQITGLQAAIVATPTSGIYGGIDKGTWTFWRNQSYTFATDLGASATASTIQQGMDGLYAACSRGRDTTKLIVFDNFLWSMYMASLQNLSRVEMNSELASLGFQTVKFIGADVVLDGGIDGNCPAHIGYFINPSYLFYRPHSQRNFAPIGGERMSTNQDATVQLLGWAGNLTASGLKFQGYLHA